MPRACHPLAFPRLRSRQAELDVDNRALAELVGIAPGTLSQIHRGRMAPSAGLRARIAEALDSTVEELFVPANAWDAA